MDSPNHPDCKADLTAEKESKKKAKKGPTSNSVCFSASKTVGTMLSSESAARWTLNLWTTKMPTGIFTGLMYQFSQNESANSDPFSVLTPLPILE